jgi:hypothetical protein
MNKKKICLQYLYKILWKSWIHDAGYLYSISQKGKKSFAFICSIGSDCNLIRNNFDTCNFLSNIYVIYVPDILSIFRLSVKGRLIIIGYITGHCNLIRNRFLRKICYQKHLEIYCLYYGMSRDRVGHEMILKKRGM